jgi:hypothetical protein
VPFLRLTRDRRGFENTFLMHADRPGDRPRLLYWYRTAPGVMLGRAALDEDAIRTIEEQHPDIDFDWPAIIALSEVMTPEDEAPAPRPQQQQQQLRKEKKGRNRDSASARGDSRELRRDRLEQPKAIEASGVAESFSDRDNEETAVEMDGNDSAEVASEPVQVSPPADQRGLVEELAGREIAGRLRARYAEIVARIDSLDLDGAAREAWLTRAEAIDPDAWESPEAVLHGVSNADAAFEKLKTELGHRLNTD